MSARIRKRHFKLVSIFLVDLNNRRFLIETFLSAVFLDHAVEQYARKMLNVN